jgi:hypothetical protein
MQASVIVTDKSSTLEGTRNLCFGKEWSWKGWDHRSSFCYVWEKDYIAKKCVMFLPRMVVMEVGLC